MVAYLPPAGFLLGAFCAGLTGSLFASLLSRSLGVGGR